MTGLKKALYAFWSQFGIPAYADDQVPDDAKPPYCTYSVSLASINGTTTQRAFVWCPDEKPYGNVWRTEMADRLQQAIPVGGVMLPIDDGYIVLERNTSLFLSDWQDINDESVLGVRCSYMIRHYHM